MTQSTSTSLRKPQKWNLYPPRSAKTPSVSDLTISVIYILTEMYVVAVVLFETSMMCTITDFGMKNKKGEHEASMWDGLKPKFLEHVGEIDEELKKAGLPTLVKN